MMKKYVLTAPESHDLDQYAIHSIGYPGVVLMEHAAQEVARQIVTEIHARNVAIFCGGGNNGRDGLAVARLLSLQGISVKIFLTKDPEQLSPDAKVQWNLTQNLQVPFEVILPVSFSYVSLESYDLIVDALFGVGLNRPLGPEWNPLISAMNERKSYQVLAIDIPSGISATTGKVLGNAIRADITVTMGFDKAGLLLYPGREYAGKKIVADIGYPMPAYEAMGISAYTLQPEDLGTCLIPREPSGHKGTFGHVAVIGGCETMAGAVVFAAKAAYKVGAGLVTVCSVSQNRSILLSQVPEAIFTSYEPDHVTSESENGFREDENDVNTKEILTILDRADVVVLGPGLGISDRSQGLIDFVMTHCKVPLILDGDGLTLAVWEKGSYSTPMIATPHLKELSGISGVSIREIKENFPYYVQSFANQYQITLVAKDATTLVCKGNTMYYNQTGNHGMGTGGSGDCLTGIIAGLIAQGYEDYQGAVLGTLVHGMAGDYFAEEHSPYALTASDLIASLDEVLPTKNPKKIGRKKSFDHE